MNSVNISMTQATARLQHMAGQLWYRLSTPRLLLILLPLLLIILGLTLILPQQSLADFGSALSAETIWLNSLPVWLTPLGRPLYSLGFSQLLNSFWFWLPAALLLGHSLIALAHYAPISWQRFREANPSLQHQHPLSQRVEHSVRLSDSPDEQIKATGELLRQTGYTLHDNLNDASDQRLLVASRHRWAWLGPVIFYSGLLLLIGAFFVSSLALDRDRLTLTTGRDSRSNSFNGSFSLTNVDFAGQTAAITFRPATGQTAQTLTWQLYRPTWLANTLIIPTGLEPLLTIAAQDEASVLVPIVPLQGQAPTSQRLTVPLSAANEPFLFSIPNTSLVFQLTAPENGSASAYELQVRRGAEATLISDVSLQPGQPVQVEALTVLVTRDYRLQAITWRDPALLIYGLSVGFLLAGLLAYLRPPATVWLIPEVKGRGGQLYGVMEGFRSEVGLKAFLQSLLGTEEDSAS